MSFLPKDRTKPCARSVKDARFVIPLSLALIIFCAVGVTILKIQHERGLNSSFVVQKLLNQARAELYRGVAEIALGRDADKEMEETGKRSLAYCEADIAEALRLSGYLSDGGTLADIRVPFEAFRAYLEGSPKTGSGLLKDVYGSESLKTLETAVWRMEEGARHSISVRANTYNNISTITIVVSLVALALVLLGSLRMENRRRKAEAEALEERERRLEQGRKSSALESIGVLAGGIAHDFNNLLGGLFGYLELASNKIEAGSAAGLYLGKAMSVFGRASDLARRLLTFSKGGAPTKTEGDLGAVVRQAIVFALSGSKVAPDFSIEPDLPRCAFDPAQVAQVFENLAINAVQAMPNGGRLRVSASKAPRGAADPAGQDGAWILVEVADTGPGFPPEFAEKIFDPYFTTKERGTGLGLSICFSIVNKHGGTIEAESVPGSGATFRVRLPALAEAPGRPAPEAKTDPAQHPAGRRARVLVVDDEHYIREVTQAALEAMGIDSSAASDGREALELMRALSSQGAPGAFDAVIIDLTIPGGMGGLEAIGPLRALAPDLPIYAMSGYSDGQAMADPRSLGFTGFLAKPFRKEDLERILSSARLSS
jgi:signal transduction histidine kinase/CheY-like chemotaxis protein